MEALIVIIAIVLGIIFGIIAGLTPGLHTNLIASILLLLTSLALKYFSPIILIIFIVSLSITNIFLEMIPSIYLGAPDEETALSVLPGHELLLKGKGHQAVFLSALGGLSGIIILLIVSPIFFIFLPSTYPFFEKMMLWLLVWICIFIIKDNKQKILAAIFFIFSGIFGFASLNLNISQPLLPLLTGLFGTSGIIFSLNGKTNLPNQEAELEKLDKKSFFRPILASFLVSPICSFLPGLGGSQAAIIGSKIAGELEREQFLFLNGSINIALMGLSFVTLFLINKSRTGSAAIISQIGQITFRELLIILALILVISMISFYLTLIISKNIANKIGNWNYRKISISILIFLVALTGIISGVLGLLVLLTGTCLGLSCQYYGLRKGILMGCLLIPTIIIYWKF
ncbi:Tripartite tricarboxylate transporter TctA family protein [uncultured archaeon]|nr:Tripartite tricarboxylate transporter TctA family protein [uncultured archaeon]